jgi:membrane-associated phospholipid phosphatase
MNYFVLADCISISLLPLIASCIILFLFTANQAYLWIFIGVFIVERSTSFIKSMIKSGPAWLYRPEGATRCSMLNRGHKPGLAAFPSGHMSTCVFIVIALLLANRIKNKSVWLLAFIYMAAMGWSRYYKKCHYVSQIMAGFIYGTVFAVLFYYYGFLAKNHRLS